MQSVVTQSGDKLLGGHWDQTAAQLPCFLMGLWSISITRHVLRDSVLCNDLVIQDHLPVDTCSTYCAEGGGGG